MPIFSEITSDTYELHTNPKSEENEKNENLYFINISDKQNIIIFCKELSFLKKQERMRTKHISN